MSFPYEDIVSLPHPEPRRHTRMSMEARAAQFAPFAALCGHEEAIRETARHTEPRHERSEEERELLNRRHAELMARLAAKPLVTFTLFRPDTRKEGGSLETITGRVDRVDEQARVMTLTNARVIAMDDLVRMDADFFEDLP